MLILLFIGSFDLLSVRYGSYYFVRHRLNDYCQRWHVLWPIDKRGMSGLYGVSIVSGDTSLALGVCLL